MAREKKNKNPSPATRFKKGVSGNPGGKPKIPEDLKNIKVFSSQELHRIISRHLRMGKEESLAFVDEGSADMISLIVASALNRSLESGDFYKVEQLLMRLLGRVTDTVEVPHPVPVVIERRDGSIVELTTKQPDQPTIEAEEAS